MNRKASSLVRAVPAVLLLGAVATAGARAADAPAPAAAATDSASVTIDAFIKEKATDTTKEGWKQKLPEPPKAKFDAAKKYYWDLTTNVGKMSVLLKPEVAPMHVSSTMYLTKLGYFDGVIFHRVIKGFMAQGGDPTGTGRGGPGYEMDLEVSGSVKHDKRGVLSTANAGPGTDGSQFFLTFKATPFLDGGYTVFGEVVSGRETIDELEKRGAASDPGKPSEKLVIEKATIRVE